MRTAATILIALLLSAVRAPASPRAAAAIPGIAAESAETAAAGAADVAAGADVAIMAESGGETFAAAALTDAAGFLCYARARGCTFADSAVVFTAAYMHWTREDDPAGGFRLRDSAGRYLAVGGSDDATCMTALSAGRPDEPFTISHGAIAVAHQGDTLLLVLLSHRSGRRSTLAFGFIPAASYDASRYSRTYLAPLLSDISAERTGDGALRLTGHCTPALIRTYADSAVTSIDMTGAMLPTEMPDSLADIPASCLLLMRSADAARAPRSGRIIAVDSGGTARLTAPLALSDPAAFVTPCALSPGSGMLSYTRTFPTLGWSTLCLPFTPESIPQGMQVFTPASISDGTITLDSVTSIEALRPYIVRITGDGAYRTLTFTARVDEPVPPTVLPRQKGQMFGTLTRFIPDETEGTFLFLCPDGITFAAAAAGSWLLPSRCGWLLSPAAASALRIGGDAITAVTPVRESAQHPVIYTIDGLRCPGDESAQRGLYIVNGKKKYLR